MSEQDRRPPRSAADAAEAATPGARAAAAVDAATRGFLRGTARDRGYERVAKFLVLIGQQPAARVLEHLTETEVQGITAEIARIRTVEKREAFRILEEFGYLVKTRDLFARGGQDKARQMLSKAFGEERGAAMFTTIMQRTTPHPFVFLADYEPEQVVGLLHNESPAVISVILAHLSPPLAAQLLAALDPDQQREVVNRIANLGTVPAEVIQSTEEALKRKIRTQGKVITEQVDGTSVLAEILGHMDGMREQAILDGLEDAGGDLAQEVKRKLLTEELLLQIDSRDLQRVLAERSDRQLALILRSAGAAVAAHLAANLSSGRNQMVRGEDAALGPVLASEIDGALRELLEDVHRQTLEGSITVLEAPPRQVP